MIYSFSQHNVGLGNAILVSTEWKLATHIDDKGISIQKLYQEEKERIIFTIDALLSDARSRFTYAWGGGIRIPSFTFEYSRFSSGLKMHVKSPFGWLSMVCNTRLPLPRSNQLDSILFCPFSSNNWNSHWISPVILFIFPIV